MTHCDQCGFVYDELPAGEIAERIRSGPVEFRQAISGAAGDSMTRRPDPAVWSALEYICHVRDVLLVQRDRAIVALVEDSPSFPRMYRDERVDLCNYNAQEAPEVLDQLTTAAELCSLVFAGVAGSAWSRALIYNAPAPTKFDLAWLGRHTVHEVEHHRQDVIAVLERVKLGK